MWELHGDRELVLTNLPAAFIRDCDECGCDTGRYDPRTRTLTATPEQLADLKDRASHYAGDGLDAAPLWMKPAARALLRAIEKSEQSRCDREEVSL